MRITLDHGALFVFGAAVLGASAGLASGAPAEFVGMIHDGSGQLLLPAVLVGFDPQPEPPGFPAAVQFDFSMVGARGSEFNATLALRVHNGDELMRFDVPGPAGLALLGPVAVWVARRRR